MNSSLFEKSFGYILKRGIRKNLDRVGRMGVAGTLHRVLEVSQSAIGIYLCGRFDAKLNIDTQGELSISQLDIPAGHENGAMGFGSTYIYSFRKFFSSLKDDYFKTTFIDFGSGKGRAVFLAAEFPFQKCIGVEFAKNLADIADRNLTNLNRNPLICNQIEFRHTDARTFPLPTDENCFLFFYTPFNADVMQVLFKNVANSFDENPRKILLCHCSQVDQFETDYTDVITCSDHFRHIRTVRLKRDWREPSQVEFRLFGTYKYLS